MFGYGDTVGGTKNIATFFSCCLNYGASSWQTWGTAAAATAMRIHSCSSTQLCIAVHRGASPLPSTDIRSYAQPQPCIAVHSHRVYSHSATVPQDTVLMSMHVVCGRALAFVPLGVNFWLTRHCHEPLIVVSPWNFHNGGVAGLQVVQLQAVWSRIWTGHGGGGGGRAALVRGLTNPKASQSLAIR
eukprot:360269-Chlamydomonas_euryale.AAC.10